MTSIRLSQIALSTLLGVHVLLIVITNLTDYNVNFAFVQQVLSMQDTFAPSRSWRAIGTPGLAHFFYALIIATEAIIAMLCLFGSLRMWKARESGSAQFDTGKKTAVYGILLGLALWFGAFGTVAGEWFLMWQSKNWNAQGTAFFLTIIYGVALLVMLKQEGRQ